MRVSGKHNATPGAGYLEMKGCNSPFTHMLPCYCKHRPLTPEDRRLRPFIALVRALLLHYWDNVALETEDKDWRS